MNKKRCGIRRGIPAGVILLAVIAGSSPAGAARMGRSSADLASILRKTADYCRKLEASVLDFVCREEVMEKVDPTRDTEKPVIPLYEGGMTAGTRVYLRAPAKYKASFAYDYQCIRTAGVIKETRTLIEENGKAKNEPSAQLKTLSLVYHHGLLGPVNLFGGSRQQQYDFAVTGSDVIDKKTVVVVEAKPKSGVSNPACLSGKAWIDPVTADVLRIEWTQAPAGGREIFEKRAARLESILRLTLRTEFRAEKNGIRFPSNVSIEEAYVDKKGQVFVRSETTVVYKDFKFFTVQVEIDKV